MRTPTLVIAGTHSGTGKTFVALAATAALRRRGLRVQTFKVGPDFLDPSHLALASGRPCYNLDTWMCGPEYAKDLFARKVADAEVAIIEGVMGLYDGASSKNSEGSTAEVARLLHAPILLVVDAQGAARSLAATVSGFVGFEPGLRFAGVLANRCGSEQHGRWLAESLASVGAPTLCGAISRGALPSLPSRHLGLVTADPTSALPSALEALAGAFEQSVQVERLLQVAREQAPEVQPTHRSPSSSPERRVRVGIARDRAFHFYYPDTLESLEAAGVEWVPFSPLADATLPDGLDALYLGGGYPEEYAGDLSANESMREAVRTFCRSGRAVYAECGGLMYLSQGVERVDGTRHAMTGVLPVWTRMLEKRKALGYVEVRLRTAALWGDAGAVARGHEFHYSELATPAPEMSAWSQVYELRRRRSEDVTGEGFQYQRVLASYVHLHLGSRPEAVNAWAAACGRKEKA